MSRLNRYWTAVIGLLLGTALGVLVSRYGQSAQPGPELPRGTGHTNTAPDIHKAGRSYVAEYFDSNVWDDIRWLGVRLQKLPLDMWIYQEILFETRPDVLIEAGTLRGGSAYYFATLFDLLGAGRVITIDITEQPDRPEHPRITYLIGSSTSEEVFRAVKELIGPDEKVMVVLDSDHRRDHVAEELELYAPLVTPGLYLVVEDTCVNGNPVLPDFGPGPLEAVRAFLPEHPEFQVDANREKFGATFYPNGWLRRTP